MATMGPTVTEKTYPIQTLWVLEPLLTVLYLAVAIGCTGVLVFLFFGEPWKWLGLLAGAVVPLPFFMWGGAGALTRTLRKLNLHYAVEEKFFTIKHGVLSKQQRHIPYAVMQNVLIYQDVFDRGRGLACLIIENAAQGGGNVEGSVALFRFPILGRGFEAYELRGLRDTPGSSGNKVSIPGLRKEHAEILKRVLVERMKEYRVDKDTSGL